MSILQVLLRKGFEPARSETEQSAWRDTGEFYPADSFGGEFGVSPPLIFVLLLPSNSITFHALSTVVEVRVVLGRLQPRRRQRQRQKRLPLHLVRRRQRQRRWRNDVARPRRRRWMLAWRRQCSRWGWRSCQASMLRLRRRQGGLSLPTVVELVFRRRSC